MVALAIMESKCEIPALIYSKSNLIENEGHCMVGSLTGVVASESVSEAFKGTLSTLGNRT